VQPTFLMKTLPRVAAEMALHVLAYNMTRVLNIMGTKPLIAAMSASLLPTSVRPLLRNRPARPTVSMLPPARFCTTKTQN